MVALGIASTVAARKLTICRKMKRVLCTLRWRTGDAYPSEAAVPTVVPCPDSDDKASAQELYDRGKTLLDGSRVGELPGRPFVVR